MGVIASFLLSNPWRTAAIALTIALGLGYFLHWTQVSYLNVQITVKEARITTLEGELKTLVNENQKFKADLDEQRAKVDAFVDAATAALKESERLLESAREDNKRLRAGTEQLVGLIKLSKDECVGIFDVLDEIIKRRQK